MKNLNIQARGNIKGGFIEYAFREDGVVLYRGELRAKVMFFSKTIPFTGSYQMPDEEMILSECYRVVGSVLNFDLLTLTVMEVVGNIAKVNVSSDYGSGMLILNLSQPVVSIQSLDVKGRAAGYNIEIVAA